MSEVFVFREYRYAIYDRNVSFFPYYTNDKTGIKIDVRKYLIDIRSVYDYIDSQRNTSKNKMIAALLNPDCRYLHLRKTLGGKEYILGHRLLFHIENDIIIPAIVITADGTIHIQTDIWVNAYEKGLLKALVKDKDNVTLHDNLAGEFFVGLGIKFKDLKEKTNVGQQLLNKLIGHAEDSADLR